jgi:uncharacterized protein (TIGR00288 family)
MENEKRMAMLIDADNAQRKSLQGIIEEIAVYGNTTIKRIYGDWTEPNMNGWKASLLDNGITPIQQYRYTTGKNATDSAMIIDAMDILYTGKVDVFCLVSSDSDFTRLALRLREAGMMVIGIGEKKTPNPFIKSCDRFIYIEIILQRAKEALVTAAKKAEKKAAPPTVEATSEVKTDASPVEANIPQKLIDRIAAAIEDVADEDGWAYLGEVGGLLQKMQPDFDSRSYGFKKLSQLIAACDDFAVDIRESLQKGHGNRIFISVKKTG